MTSTQSPNPTEAEQDQPVEEAPLINPQVAPPEPATPPVAEVEHQSPFRRLLAAFGFGRVR
jgi:hypothetical protein